jgi:hypothetical protein
VPACRGRRPRPPAIPPPKPLPDDEQLEGARADLRLDTSQERPGGLHAGRLAFESPELAFIGVMAQAEREPHQGPRAAPLGGPRPGDTTFGSPARISPAVCRALGPARLQEPAAQLTRGDLGCRARLRSIARRVLRGFGTHHGRSGAPAGRRLGDRLRGRCAELCPGPRDVHLYLLDPAPLPLSGHGRTLQLPAPAVERHRQHARDGPDMPVKREFAAA